MSQIPSEIVPWASCRAMDKAEIKQARKEHVDAAKRARAAGFDLITILNGLATFPNFFLHRFHNKRTDEYGGSFENRIRFTLELMEELRETIDDCAIGVRFCIDTLDQPFGYGDLGTRADGEGTGDRRTGSSGRLLGSEHRHVELGRGRRLVAVLRVQSRSAVHQIASSVSSKPLMNVGRFTDPDLMVEVITSGQCDIIGAARPSIADPFLPKKIEEGRPDDIRECIGCNVCVSRWESARARSGVPRTPPAARSTVVVGIRRSSPRLPTGTTTCWWSVPARRAWSALASSVSEGCAGFTWSMPQGHGRAPQLGDDVAGPRQLGSGHELPEDPDRQDEERSVHPQDAAVRPGHPRIRG